MKKEELRKVYVAPSESFHQCVVNTLDSLEETPAKHNNHRMIVAICVAAVILTVFTVTAAASGMFGLIATKRGTYGLDVTVENSESSDSTRQGMKLKFGYLPAEYESGESDNSSFNYENEGTYFTACICYTDYYSDDINNVIKTEETEYDGHKTLIISFKEAKNTDKMYYSTLKYFDKYNCLVRCNGSDYDKLKIITEKVDVEPELEPIVPKDVRDEDDPPSVGALTDYSNGESGFRDEFLKNKVNEARIGDIIDLSVADYGQEAVHLTAKVTSVKEQDNIDGLDSNDFLNLGTETTYQKYFNGDGTIIKQSDITVNDGADDYDLGTARTISLTRHFYIAEIELTAQNDIDDLHRAFGTEVYCIDVDKKDFYDNYTLDYESVLKIYGTGINHKQSIKNGETLNVKIGFITENDTANNTYIVFSAVDAPNDLYQNYMIKVKK